MQPQIGRFVCAALVGRKGERGKIIQGVVIHIGAKFIKIRTVGDEPRTYHCSKRVETVKDSYLREDTLREVKQIREQLKRQQLRQ